MEGRTVVTSDDHKLGTVVAEPDGFVVVESGHMFKARHAIPSDFLHEHEDVVRAMSARTWFRTHRRSTETPSTSTP